MNYFTLLPWMHMLTLICECIFCYWYANVYVVYVLKPIYVCIISSDPEEGRVPKAWNKVRWSIQLRPCLFLVLRAILTFILFTDRDAAEMIKLGIITFIYIYIYRQRGINFQMCVILQFSSFQIFVTAFKSKHNTKNDVLANWMLV